MKAVSRWLDRFCYDHPNFGVPNLMKYIVIGNVMVYFLDLFSRGYASWMLSFSSPLILQGQVWRVLSFVFVPVATGGATPLGRALFFAMTTLFYYYIGNALERQWGTTRFTVFYGLGVLLNIIMGFVMGGTSMYYINMSMFFAFATLYPEMQVLPQPWQSRWRQGPNRTEQGVWDQAAAVLPTPPPARSEMACGCPQPLEAHSPEQ